MKKLKDIPVPTLITGMVGVVWLGSFALRSMNPEFTGGPAADALMATTVAWWAKTRKAKNGPDDLISEVLTQNVLPMVSHTPPAASPPPAAYPKPAPTPYQPPQSVPPPHSPPASKPKQGGLPWGG